MISPGETLVEAKSSECLGGLSREPPEVPLPLGILVEPPAVAPERFEALAVELWGRKTKCLPLRLVEMLQARSQLQYLKRLHHSKPKHHRTRSVPFGRPELFLGHYMQNARPWPFVPTIEGRCASIPLRPLCLEHQQRVAHSPWLLALACDGYENQLP